ncbi:MAG: ATP-binding protein [Pseudomonadota bacterium]
MTSIPTGERRIRPLWRRVLRAIGLPRPVEHWLRRRLPRRLFARSLLIIVVPMIILQSVVAFVFLDRHWESMTERLSVATAEEIAAVSDLLEGAPPEERERIVEVARLTLFTDAELIEAGPLPPPAPKPFFSLLDRTLSRRISEHVNRPFWVNTTETPRYVEIRVKLDVGTLRIITRRSQTYASDSHITLVWMVGTSLVLIAVALLFLKNQVRPIQELAAAAERFGRGRPVGPLRPHGAIEVRQAAWAFIEMKQRIERQIEQRTTMLAGVSHDLRTMLTRFRLELALLEQTDDVSALTEDVDAMQAMLEDYITFAKASADEPAVDVRIAHIVEDAVRGVPVRVDVEETLEANIRPLATRRIVANLVANASVHADTVAVSAHMDGDVFAICVDDDGPGVPDDQLESVFRPFVRLDTGRNQNVGGTGLGLTIARDLARRQGGDITLSRSPLGGLRATIRLPQ